MEFLDDILNPLESEEDSDSQPTRGTSDQTDGTATQPDRLSHPTPVQDEEAWTDLLEGVALDDPTEAEPSKAKQVWGRRARGKGLSASQKVMLGILGLVVVGIWAVIIVLVSRSSAARETDTALSLDGADPFVDLGAIGDFPPFDAVYLPAENQEHVAVTTESREWFLDEILGDVTAVAPANDLTTTANALQLRGASPNPFNPRTEIAFAVPENGPTRLSIVDARGRKVRTLIDASLIAGDHAAVWDGRDEGGRSVAAGVFLAVVEQGGSRVAKRLTLVR